MGKFQHDMRDEDERNTFEMPDGWHKFEIVNIREDTSSRGNEMFVAKVVSTLDYEIGIEVYLVATKGKRWFLKQLLRACDCPAAEDGVYDWSEEDVEGKTVEGRVEHQQEDDWTDRQGKTRPGKIRAKIAEFRKLKV